MTQVQTPQQEQPPLWQRKWFVESIWISGFTRWLLTFGGKAARIVLIICTLYMSAQLYPGVSLPPGLSLAVFILLSFSLDMGGLGLAQIANTAREHGNEDGAKQGERLAKWLITIMIAGLVTVSLEHAVTMLTLTPQWKNGIAVFWIIVEIALSIARVICAVNYGHVVHALEQSVERDDEQAQEEQEAQRAEITRLQQEVSTLQPQLNSANRKVDILNGQVDTLSGQLREKAQEVDTLHFQLSTEQQRVSTLQEELETGHGDTAGLRRELNAARIEADTLRTQLTGKKQEVEGLREQLQRGQEWQGSRIASLQQELEAEQTAGATLRRQLHTAQLDADTLRAQLDGKQQEVERVQAELVSGQQEVSSLQRKLEMERQRVSTLQQKLNSGQSLQVSTGRAKVDSGQESVNSGQRKVVRLDATRSRKSGQDEDELAERIKELILASPSLSDRAIAIRLQCSPTTVGRKRKAMGLTKNEDAAVNE